MPDFRSLDVPGSEDAGKQNRQLLIRRSEPEIQVVDPEHRQRKRVRRIDRRPDGHRLRVIRRAVADDPLALLLHEIAQAVGGFAIHHPVAFAGRRAIAIEGFGVDVEIAEVDRLLHEKIAPGDQHDLARRQAAEQEHRTIPDDDRRVALRFVVRDDRRRQAALNGVHADPRKRLHVDPHRSPVERAVFTHRVEADDVAVVAVDAFAARQPVAVAVVEAELQREREQFFRLQQRKRRAIDSPLGAVDREGQLLPLDFRARDEVAILRRRRHSRDR